MSSCFEPKNREDGRVFSLNDLCFQLKLPLIDLTWTSFWCICIKIEILEHTQKKTCFERISNYAKCEHRSDIPKTC